MNDPIEVVVAGGGLPALACGAQLAEEGVTALVLDPAPEPGAKSPGGLVAGFREDPYSLDAVVDDLHEEAPLGRALDGASLHALSREHAAELDLTLSSKGGAWRYAARRSRLEAWLADRVHEALREHGGGVLPGVHAGELVREDGEVVGVDPDGLDPVRADAIVAADGPASPLARRAGLAPTDPRSWLLRVQVRASAEPDAIEDAVGDEGAKARFLAGHPFEGAPGAGHVLPGEEAVHVGATARLDAFEDGARQPHELLDDLLEHPFVKEAVPAGAEEAAYSATAIPNGPRARLDDPTAGRLLLAGAAAGHVRVRGPLVDPVRPGIAAGIAAARAWAAADGPGDVAQRYRAQLDEAGLLDQAAPSGFKRALAGGRGPLGGTLAGLASTGLGRRVLATGWGRSRVQAVLDDPEWSAAAHGSSFATVTLPRLLAEETGRRLPADAEGIEPRSLDARLEHARFDVTAQPARVELQARGEDAAGALVHACPVAAPAFSRGALRFEPAPEGASHERFVAADARACIECGACPVVGPVDYEPAPGGGGIRFDE